MRRELTKIAEPRPVPVQRPKRLRVTSLAARRVPLASPDQQLAELAKNAGDLNFIDRLRDTEFSGGITPAKLEIFQINLGKLCNMTCRHCHVDAGPDRTAENMDRNTIDACLKALDKTSAHTVDLTGGAPELNPHFEYLVDECVRRGKHVIDRCNLTVLMLPKYQHLPEWFAERGVEVVCSLPHYRARNTDAQRGDGTYEKSIAALARLNEAGYGQGHPDRILTLMSNPAGCFLAGDQTQLESEWKKALFKNHGVTFDRLFCLNNMPISRFLEWLLESGNLAGYMQRLSNAYNPATANGLMCRNTMSVSWDGKLFDCDFNQMLEMDSRLNTGETMTIHDFEPQLFAQRTIQVDRHCFGCTAGSGSSCGGATT
ncbi:MAG: arsenosugar biosynthesis radical SAM (seleno)protein ArsS [Myxococcota bacterium]|nr:arsenosugar biosynthesis radical SAM (seleno)protein ArsS [Myxococcota bacterium]